MSEWTVLRRKRVAELEAENERLRGHREVLAQDVAKADAEVAQLSAENERLREAGNALADAADDADRRGTEDALSQFRFALAAWRQAVAINQDQRKED